MYEIEFYDYCAERIDDFERRADIARDKMDRDREPLFTADYDLYREICDCLQDFCDETGIDPGEVDDII